MGNRLMSPFTGLAVGIVCFGGSLAMARGPVSDQTLEVTVWGLDGTQVEAGVTATLPDGATVKPIELATGVYQFDAMPPKAMLTVEIDEFDLARKELSFPDGDVIHVDVVCVDAHTTEFLMDLGAAAKHMPSDSPFGLRTPINDEIGGAPNLGVPSLITGTTSGATVDSGLPEGDLPITSPGVWYVVEGTGTTMTASTCSLISAFDTKVSVFCDGPAPTMIGGNDDSACAGPFQSAATWCSEAGQYYRVLVHGFGGQAGRFQLSIEADQTPCTGEILCSSGGGNGLLGACCLPTQVCVDGVTSGICEEMNGMWQGEGTSCEPTDGIFEGYDVGTCDSEFENIADFGEHGPDGDDNYEEVPIGFDFTFFGDTYSSVKMSTNGYLTFGPDAEEHENQECGDTDEPNNFIAPLWDDLVVGLLSRTRYITLGDPGDRRFIAQWTFVLEFGQPLSRATFQAVFYEADSCIEFRYHLLHHVPSFEGDCTVGIENAAGDLYYCVPDTELYEGFCYEFCPLFTPPTPGVECPCVTIDFETDDYFAEPLANGEQVWPNVNNIFGNLIEIEINGSGVAGGGIFDTDPTGPNQNSMDPDLLVDTGNALICQNIDYAEQTVAGYYDYPNDASTGGNINIDFTDYHGVAPISIDLIDICNTDSSVPAQIKLIDFYGNCRFYSIPRGWTEDLVVDGPPAYRTLYLDTLVPQPGYEATATATDCIGDDFYDEYVVRMEINFNGSGACDNLYFCRNLDEPEPCEEETEETVE